MKSRLVLPFWYRLTQVVLEKRPLNGSSSSSSSNRIYISYNVPFNFILIHLAFNRRWSCVFHPGNLVLRFPVLRFPPPYFSRSRVFQSRVFSPPLCRVGRCELSLEVVWQSLDSFRRRCVWAARRSCLHGLRRGGGDGRQAGATVLTCLCDGVS